MRKLIATVFDYWLDGFLADEGTEFWKFCFDLPSIADDPAQLDFFRSASARHGPHRLREHRRGHDDNSDRLPLSPPILNAARKVVFSRT